MYKANVLHIIDTLGVGGAEKVMVGTVNSMPDFRHYVVYLSGSDEMAANLPASCQILKLNLRSKFDMLRCAFVLRRYIRKNNITVVHSHLFMSTIVARLACPSSVKLFTTIHSIPSQNYFAESNMAKWIEKLTYRKKHHMIAICHEVFKDYNECIGIKGEYTILYNYVEDVYHAAHYKKMSFNGTFRMVAVGNLKKAKNYPYLLEAFKLMPKNIHLDIYGAGPLKNELESTIKKFNLNIRLCGVRNDIHHVLPQYDAFIMSSIFEGQPISLLEAMASGLPAILSDIPVLREVTGNNAIFYDLQDVNDAVIKITAIANHQVDLDKFALSNFERVKMVAGKSNYMSTLGNLYMSGQKSVRKEYYSQSRRISVKTSLPGIPAQA